MTRKCSRLQHYQYVPGDPNTPGGFPSNNYLAQNTHLEAGMALPLIYMFILVPLMFSGAGWAEVPIWYLWAIHAVLTAFKEFVIDTSLLLPVLDWAPNWMRAVLCPEKDTWLGSATDFLFYQWGAGACVLILYKPGLGVALYLLGFVANLGIEIHARMKGRV